MKALCVAVMILAGFCLLGSTSVQAQEAVASVARQDWFTLAKAGIVKKQVDAAAKTRAEKQTVMDTGDRWVTVLQTDVIDTLHPKKSYDATKIAEILALVATSVVSLESTLEDNAATDTAKHNIKSGAAIVGLGLAIGCAKAKAVHDDAPLLKQLQDLRNQWHRDSRTCLDDKDKTAKDMQKLYDGFYDAVAKAFNDATPAVKCPAQI